MEQQSQFVFDPRFAEAFLGTEHMVLGRPLLPFCTWHKFQLEIINSPILLNEPCSLIHLSQAVQVCQTVYPNVARFSKQNTKWRRFLWFLRHRKYNFHKELWRFGDYLSANCSGPKLWERAGNGGVAKEPDVDDNLEAVCFYWKHAKCTEREAWMTPLGKLRWYNTLFSRMEGAEVDFWTPADDVAFKAHVEKREARIEAKAQEYHAAGQELAEARERAKAEYWAEVSKKLGKNVKPS